MAAGVPYEKAEEYFGSGEEYSHNTLDNNDAEVRRDGNGELIGTAYRFFAKQGKFLWFVPAINPVLKAGRRYLLSTKSYDPLRPWMAHSVVLDETGKVFDPDPKYDPANPKSIATYPDIIAWEIISCEPLEEQ
jgi:hypothetical protein